MPAPRHSPPSRDRRRRRCLFARPALFVVAGGWLVNQAVGFGALHYPIDANTILWGFTIGAAALFATLVSALVLRALAKLRTPLALTITLIGVYGAYELAIFAATPFLGEGGFTAAIIGRLGLLNLFWLIALLAVCEIARLLNSARGTRFHELACQQIRP